MSFLKTYFLSLLFMVSDSTYGSGSLNLTRRHGHFLNLTCDMAPLYSDMTRGGKSIVTCDIGISQIGQGTW